jgi:phosphatidylserine/phosphatidylglycerophosphate/cardiolipin synthase-like enzyme
MLSERFQSYLEVNDGPPLYFPDDPLGTAKEFWRTFAGAIRVETRRAQRKEHQDKVEQDLDRCRQSQAPQDGQIMKRGSAELQESERGPKEFADRIERAPKVEYLYQAEQHRDVLRRVLKEARDTVIIISPWIRSRALEPLIPEIRKALERQVEVWIGYGMPPNPKHKDNTDPHAVDSLLELTSEGHLYVVKSKYGTHEKVLIRDHDLSVVGSWNWLSYGGGDGRGEMSTMVEGQDHVRELQMRTLLRLQKELQEASE